MKKRTARKTMKIRPNPPRSQRIVDVVVFGRGSRKHMRRLSRDVMSGKLQPAIEKQEADLYMNPRRVR